MEELRLQLEEKNKMMEKKTHQNLMSTPDRSKDMHELRDHIEIKDRKINVLQRKV